MAGRNKKTTIGNSFVQFGIVDLLSALVVFAVAIAIFTQNYTDIWTTAEDSDTLLTQLWAANRYRRIWLYLCLTSGVMSFLVPRGLWRRSLTLFAGIAGLAMLYNLVLGLGLI